MRNDIKLGVIAFSVTVLALAGARAQPASTLDRIMPGEWELREVGGTSHHTFCVANPAALVWLRAQGAGCTRSVISDEAGALVVHHSCPGTGQGRSLLTVRSPRSIRLELQGVERGLPFAEDYEGRMIGPCAGGH